MPQRPLNLSFQAFLALGAVLLSTGCSMVGIRTVEEARYDVLAQEGPFEIREYHPLVIAETTVEASYDEAGGKAFRRLFGYISGKNETRASIAMTAPVLANPDRGTDGESIAMTAPVLGEQRVDGWRYAFVLPADYTLETAPSPANPEVRLAEVPRRTVAVIRYSGSRSEEAMLEKSQDLRDWIASKGIEPTSAPRSAGYDPPWTLPFLRRNEVMFDVE
jgi:hypothetical protein